MFYNDIDKLIYHSPANRNYDPLALYRRLISFSEGNINKLLLMWSDKEQTEINRLAAEEQIVSIARQAFELKPFNEEDGVVDGIVLNTLLDYLDWLEKKGQREVIQPG